MPEDWRAVVAAREITAKQDIDGNATDQRGNTHDERQVETVPDRQAVDGCLRAENGKHGRMQERADRKARNDADDEAGENQELDRETHPARRLMRIGVRQVNRLGAEEDRVDEA
ncbi:hypothetical protein D3C71_1339640 [compost metagenome]